MAALMIGRAECLSSFIWAGLAADLAGVAVVVIFRLPDPTTDLRGMAELLGGAIASGVISAGLAFGLLLLIGNLLGITTNLQLIELSRPDHPLLQLLLRSAPGSYQHSLQVANLAEQAAPIRCSPGSAPSTTMWGRRCALSSSLRTRSPATTSMNSWTRPPAPA